MRDRHHFDPDGRQWTMRARRSGRRGETATHVTIEIESLGETRVAVCRRDEWESAAPDLSAILASSVGAGASRNRGQP